MESGKRSMRKDFKKIIEYISSHLHGCPQKYMKFLRISLAIIISEL